MRGSTTLIASVATAAYAQWHYEVEDGTTYRIECVVSGGRKEWTIIRDVWDEAAQDWTGETLAGTVQDFCRHHHISALVA